MGTRTRTASTRIAAAITLATVGVALGIGGIILPAIADNSSLTTLTVTVEPGNSVTIPIGTASATKLDTSTFALEAAPTIGTVTDTDGAITYAAPAAVPAADLTDISPSSWSTGTPSPTSGPTSAATPSPTVSPTPTATPQLMATSTPAPTATPTPTSAAASAPVWFTYQVCTDTADKTCFTGTVDVAITPAALTAAANFATTVQVNQMVAIPAAELVTPTSAIEWAASSVTASRGTANLSDASINYMAPATPGPETLMFKACPESAPAGCVNSIATISVVGAFALQPDNATVFTTADGAASTSIPWLTVPNPTDPATVTIVTQPRDADVTVSGTAFDITGIPADYVGQVEFTYRGCSTIDSAACATAEASIAVNPGLGFSTAAHDVQAGATTTFTLASFAAQATTWDPVDSSATIASKAPGVIVDVSKLTADGTFAVTIPAASAGILPITVCAVGNLSAARFCQTVELTVTPAAVTIIPAPTTSELPPVATATPTSNPTPAAAANEASNSSGGTGVTWYVAGGALLIMLGGWTTIRAGRH